jgi:hypothetical protein
MKNMSCIISVSSIQTTFSLNLMLLNEGFEHELPLPGFEPWSSSL